MQLGRHAQKTHGIQVKRQLLRLARVSLHQLWHHILQRWTQDDSEMAMGQASEGGAPRRQTFEPSAPAGRAGGPCGGPGGPEYSTAHIACHSISMEGGGDRPQPTGSRTSSLAHLACSEPGGGGRAPLAQQHQQHDDETGSAEGGGGRVGPAVRAAIARSANNSTMLTSANSVSRRFSAREPL